MTKAVGFCLTISNGTIFSLRYTSFFSKIHTRKRENMKFIFSFLFSIFLALPALATVANDCPSSGDDLATQCQNTPGCVWDADLSECNQCTAGYECIGGNATLCDFGNDSHKTTPAGASNCNDDWICENGYTQYVNNCLQCTDPVPTGYVRPANATDCTDYVCATGYYSDGATCTQCPQGSTTNAENSTSPTDCYCTDSTKQLIKKPDGTYFCGTCGPLGTYNNQTHECNCKPLAQANYNSTNTGDVCACVSGTSATGPSTSQNCVCDSGYPNSNNTECVTCPENATCGNNQCNCNSGYYGSCNTGCYLCNTFGRTVVNGECKMTTDTLFCDQNNQNCMKLIGITGNAPVQTATPCQACVDRYNNHYGTSLNKSNCGCNNSSCGQQQSQNPHGCENVCCHPDIDPTTHQYVESKPMWCTPNAC